MGPYVSGFWSALTGASLINPKSRNIDNRNGQVSAAACLFPGAELTFCSVGPHILSALSLVGKLPIMDGSRAVRRDVSDPSLFHHPDEQWRETVLDEVGPE